MGIDDRRQFVRQLKQGILHFQVVESKGKAGPDQEGTVLDYSAGGLRFSTKAPIRKSSKIYIKFDSEEWGKELTVVWSRQERSLLEMIGSVMWCLESSEAPGEYEIGACFLRNVEH